MKIFDKKLKITLDTNCINIRPHKYLDQIFDLYKEGRIKLYVPDSVIRDILKEEFNSLIIDELPCTLRGEAAKKRLRKIEECSVIQGSLICGDIVYGQCGGSAGGKNINILERKIKKIVNSGDDYEDIRILLLHLSVKNDLFITLNTNHFIKGGRRESFLKKLNVRIKTPVEFINCFWNKC